VDFTTDRNRLVIQVERLARMIGPSAPLDSQSAFEQALEVVSRVESPNLFGQRSLVMVGDKSILGATLETPSSATVQWVIPTEAASSGFERGTTVAFDEATALTQALQQVSERLDKHSAAAFYKIGVCTDPLTETVAQLSDGSGKAVNITLPPSLEEERSGVCDPAKIISSTREGIHRVNFVLDEAQLLGHQAQLDSIEELRKEYGLPGIIGQMRLLTEGYGSTKDPFDVGITFNESQEAPLQATAHFRGQHALFCDRKSYTVNLPGKDTRFLGPDSGSDEFYLIAMCEDAGLFRAFLGDSLYRRYDLFPPRLRYVEVTFNGESNGVYLMMEKREEELQRDSARLRGILRRRYAGISSAKGAPEIEYTSSDDETLLAAYYELAADGIDDASLKEYLQERMDLDQYLRWIALNSVLLNADTPDECLFISTESIDPEGRPTDHFRLMAWDPEDIQGACDASMPFKDENGLTFCQEAAMDRRVLANAEIFSDYVEILKSVIESLTPEVYQAVLDEAQNQLFALFDREGTARGQGIEGVLDAASAKAMISERMAESKQIFEARRVELLEGVKKYEAAQTN
jgi:hypothetical protein